MEGADDDFDEFDTSSNYDWNSELFVVLKQVFLWVYQRGNAQCRGPFHGDIPGCFELSDRIAPEQFPVDFAEMTSEVTVELPDGGLLDVVDHFIKTLQVLSS